MLLTSVHDTRKENNKTRIDLELLRLQGLASEGGREGREGRKENRRGKGQTHTGQEVFYAGSLVVKSDGEDSNSEGGGSDVAG